MTHLMMRTYFNRQSFSHIKSINEIKDFYDHDQLNGAINRTEPELMAGAAKDSQQPPLRLQNQKQPKKQNNSLH